MGQLLTDALVIKNETAQGANTATRVGTWMQNAANAIESPTGIQTISSPVGDITIDVSDPANPVLLSELAGNPNIKLLSGVIRNTAGTWAFIDDVDHEPLRLVSITQPNTTDVRIVYDKTYTKVISLISTADETYAKNGVFVGSSVGLSDSVIRLFQENELADFISYDGSAFVSLNSKFTIGSYNSGVLNLTHPACRNDVNAQVTTRDNATFDMRIGSVGATSTAVKFVNHNGNDYNGEPTTGMRFYLSRGLYKEAQPLTHTASAISGSNIWIIGLMLDA